jgi:hypothetical protein
MSPRPPSSSSGRSGFLRGRRRSRPSDAAIDCLRTVGLVAEQVAAGDSGAFVLLDVARTLTELLDLSDCRFETREEARSAGATRPVLRHGGELEMRRTRWSPVQIGLPPKGFDILLTLRGHVEGRFVCTPRRRTPVSEARLVTALALVDQAASARLIELIGR